MAKATKAADGGELQIMRLRTGRAAFNILGTSRLVFNAMSEKARRTILFPGGPMTAAEKAQNLKHNPLEEYRSSVYAHADDSHPTRLLFPCGSFKKAMATAAREMPGVRKAQIGRLVWMQNEDIDIFGVPQLFMAPVRMADISRTPDIRTRASLPAWACRLTVRFVEPQLSVEKIATLLAAAGVLVGIGDGRQEKGAFNWGQWDLVEENNPAFLALIKNAGRKAQDAALRDPAMADLETERLFTWFGEEIKRRGETNKKAKVVSIGKEAA